MSAAELDREVLDQLRVLSEAEDLSVVLGAGASAAAGLPGWDALVVRLLVASGTVADEDIAREWLATQDPALATEAARTNATDWPELVREALYGPLAQDDGGGAVAVPSALHLAVAGLAASRPPGSVGLFTLNFDLLLEDALDQAAQETDSGAKVFTRSSANARAPRGVYEVHHLHGTIAPEAGGAFEQVVLTLSDYNDLSTSLRPWQVGALQGHLQRGPMLLAGTSYRDPDVRQWLYTLDQEEHTPPRVLLLARQGMGFDRSRFQDLREELVKQWQRIGVTAVLTQDHADAAQAVREIQEMDNDGYRPPAHRARALLEAHLDTSRFNALQANHAALLDQDLEHLSPDLGSGANLTLWLADGAGRMVRWASHDRTYRAPEHLRSVPTGHDSDWVAGQALGNDVIVRRNLAWRDGTRRWSSVVAAPIVVDLPGGPPLSAAAISSATPQPLEDHDVEAWEDALSTVAERWSERLSTPT